MVGRATTLRLLLLGGALALAACNNSGKSAAPPPTSVTPPAPDPVATGATKAYDVLPCFARPSAFPNGRRLSDPVIDITLAAIFLDLTRHSPAVLAAIPLGPPANEVPFRETFPYLAVANGSPPPAGTGSRFNFRTDPETAYVQVDRMGMPAVATALIVSSRKNAYNDGTPTKDATGDYVGDLAAALTPLTNALADDFIARGLTPCAKPA